MKTVQDSDNKLQGLINDLRTDLGTNEKDTNAFDLIQENTLAISTINGKIGEVSAEKSLAAQIGDINSSLLLCAKTSELNDYKTIVENTYAT